MIKLIFLLLIYPALSFAQTNPICQISLYNNFTQAVFKAEYDINDDNKIKFTALTGCCIKISFRTENNTNYIYRLVYKNNFNPKIFKYTYNQDGTTNSMRLDTNYSYWSMSPIFFRGNGQVNYFYDSITNNRSYKVLVATNLLNSI